MIFGNELSNYLVHKVHNLHASFGLKYIFFNSSLYLLIEPFYGTFFKSRLLLQKEEKTVMFFMPHINAHEQCYYQDSILKCIHRHTLSSMLFDGIFKAHHVQILSCFTLRANVWFTI